MRAWLVFGFWDESWWTLWENETHRGKTAEAVLDRITDRLIANGEEQYESLLVVPASVAAFRKLGVTA